MLKKLATLHSRSKISLKDWLEEYKYDEEYIYYGLMLDLSYYFKQFMLERGK